MKDITRKYSNGEVTIVWKPDLCIHSSYCWRELPNVFDPTKTPWIEPGGASTKEIIEQVKRCPTEALSYFMNNELAEAKVALPVAECVVEIEPDGPLIVRGSITILDQNGKETKRNRATSFCRCGHSANKPYCDGSHTKEGYKD